MYSNKTLIAFFALALLATTALAQSRPIHTAEIFQGQVSISQDTAFDLVVHVDRPSTLGGELGVDQAFVFRSEIPLPTDLANLEGSARIVVRPDAVFIFAKGHPGIVLRTGPPELTQPSIAADGYVLNGYQLARFQSTSQDYLERALQGQPEGPAPTSLRPSDRELRSTFGSAFLPVDEDDCTSGGPGAESCNISGPSGSCNTTCNEGYDACCNEGSCTCEA